MDLDAAWARYEQRERLIAEVGDAQLARHIFHGMGEGSLAWLDGELPALDGKIPWACLASGEGRRRLRAVAARFPF